MIKKGNNQKETGNMFDQRVISEESNRSVYQSKHQNIQIQLWKSKQR
jgi:hypothetical protein